MVPRRVRGRHQLWSSSPAGRDRAGGPPVSRVHSSLLNTPREIPGEDTGRLETGIAKETDLVGKRGRGRHLRLKMNRKFWVEFVVKHSFQKGLRGDTSREGDIFYAPVRFEYRTRDPSVSFPSSETRRH